MASQPDDEGEIIIVVGRKLPKPTAEPRLVINPGGTGGLPDNPVFQYFRALLQEQTDFDVSTEFTAEQRKLVEKIIHAMANHPAFAEAFGTS